MTANVTGSQGVYVVGDVPELGGWDPAKAVRLNGGTGAQWSGAIALPPSKTINYKYIKKADGQVVWEEGDNRSLTTPASGEVTRTETFRGDTPPVTGVTGKYNVQANTSVGQNVYVVGNVPELGNWNPAAAVKLTTGSGTYPRWAGSGSLPPDTDMNAPMKVNTVVEPNGASTLSEGATSSRMIAETPIRPPTGMGTGSQIHSTITPSSTAPSVCCVPSMSSGSRPKQQGHGGGEEPARHPAALLEPLLGRRETLLGQAAVRGTAEQDLLDVRPRAAGIRRSRRPVMMCSHGCHASSSKARLRSLCNLDHHRVQDVSPVTLIDRAYGSGTDCGRRSPCATARTGEAGAPTSGHGGGPDQGQGRGAACRPGPGNCQGPL
ncbi:carbohydrate-binding module family 20 domain-containing protein [Actinomadura viridis]|uniref:carbohydrate-binding module family 20 domain-containing protein n=1 Tax=Actinomadura viridis TaxID=58110 RepID=UPI0036C9B018